MVASHRMTSMEWRVQEQASGDACGGISMLQTMPLEGLATEGCMFCGTGYRARRLALIDAQPLLRFSLAQWLKRVGPKTALTLCADIDELLRDLKPGEGYDTIVLGHGLFDGANAHLADTMEALNSALQGTPVVLVSESESGDDIIRALQCGIRGYIPTTLDLPVASAALQLVLSGGIFVPAKALLNSAKPHIAVCRREAIPSRPVTVSANAHGEEPISGLDMAALYRLGLTQREAEILCHIKEGQANRRIAENIGVSESTVVVHVRHLMRKLGATNRTQAVFNAHRMLGLA